MTYFTKQRSFGPRISLTDRQEERLIARCNEAGLTCFVDQCDSGSVYIAIDLPQWDRDINGDWYNDLDCGCGTGLAKIRMSGHDEGRRQDSTHSVVGTKAECMAAARRWVDDLIAEHSAKGLAIVATEPTA